jgi:phosphopantetheinyl transferase
MPSVELTVARFTPATRTAWLASAFSILNEPERVSAAEISSLDARARHVIGRAMIRLVGARSSGRTPQELTVAVSEAGKPALKDVPGLQVSVAHTGGIVVVASCQGTPVGVDVETRDRAMKTDPLRIAERLFSEREATSLRDLPVDEVADWFLSAWTIKESVGKAIGVGMIPALSGAVVEGRRDDLVLRDVWTGPPAALWTLHQLTAPGGDEKLAVALPAPDIKLGAIRSLDPSSFQNRLRARSDS